MPKLKASRDGVKVKLPKYVNAEMLMLEFFAGQNITLTPIKTMRGSYSVVGIHMHVDILDELIEYINANLPID